jgi:hypothetical protein
MEAACSSKMFSFIGIHGVKTQKTEPFIGTFLYNFTAQEIYRTVEETNIKIVSVSDNLNSDHVPIVFHILHLVITYKLLEPFEQFTDWRRFRSLVSNLISPRTEINSGVEANKAA